MAEDNPKWRSENARAAIHTAAHRIANSFCSEDDPFDLTVQWLEREISQIVDEHVCREWDSNNFCVVCGRLRVAGSHAREHFLDVDMQASIEVNFEVARSLHRVVRAMHDGECPKCHTIFPSHHMIQMPNLSKADYHHVCPGCGFTITAADAKAALATFAPVMAKNLKVFEDWREARRLREVTG